MTTSRVLSWQQMVLEADPNWLRDAQRPWGYEFSNGRWFRDPLPLYHDLPGSGLINDGGFLALDTSVSYDTYPVSTANLVPGAVWSNGGFVCVVPGTTPPVQPVPLLFGQLTSSELLKWGAWTLPLVSPTAGSLQLWNNGGFVCVA